MTVIDLSHPLTTDMPVYPGTPSPEIRSLDTFKRDGFRERQVTLSFHTGLHADEADTTDFPVHRTLLENDILIIGNLARLDRLRAGRFGRLAACRCPWPMPIASRREPSPFSKPVPRT